MNILWVTKTSRNVNNSDPWLSSTEFKNNISEDRNGGENIWVRITKIESDSE